jgi:hypothetical protein
MKVKPEIVAYIVRPWIRAEDIGRPVTVLRRGIRGQSVTTRNGGISLCDGPGESTGWLCDAHGGKFPCFIAEECLRPLGGDSADTYEPANAGMPQAA